MIDYLQSFSPVIQALFATGFTWGLTAIGAGAVFLTSKVDKRLLSSMLGFAAGVMIAASYWSLLAPAIEMSQDGPSPQWFPAVIGFLLGGIFLGIVDRLLPHIHALSTDGKAEGIPTSWQRSVLLVLAVTIHNIPEGLAVGVAFGAAALGLPAATIGGAIALAFGIGLQNFPEGLAISLPLRGEGMSRLKSFWYGQLSAIVEPIAGVLGAVAVLTARPILPYALSFAAGAMIFVVVEELIPSAHDTGHSDLATIGSMLGFAIMMLLDVAFA
jgi:ZIP family zinc transporter